MEIKKRHNRQYFKEIQFLFLLLVALLIGCQFVANWISPLLPEENDLIDDLSTEIALQNLFELHEDKTIFLSVNDDAATKLSKITRNFFKTKNGKELSELAFRSSYVGIFKDGSFIQEKSGQNRLATLTHQAMTISSGGLESGSLSRLEIAGKRFNNTKRGLNIFIIEEAEERVLSYSYDFFAKESPLSKGEIHYTSQLEQITISLSLEDYERLQQKRKAALAAKVLLTDEKDLVPAKIIYQEQLVKSEIRLKGDWTDHLIGDNWSFRVKLAKNKTLLGMRKFSLHHPKTRNYAGEWLFHKLMKKEGILSLQYHFVKVKLEVKSPTNTITKDLGIYALEEFFDKYLIERNQRKQGLILKIDEDPLWEERANFRETELNGWELGYMQHFKYPEAKILPFSEASIVQDAGLSQQLAIGRRLFKDYITGTKLISEVFDVELLAKYNVISNLLGADHALIAHNFRVYYNPITALLEPVAFDGNAGVKIYYPYLYRNGEKDPVYMAAYAKVVEEMSQSGYLEKALTFPKLAQTIELMERNFPEYKWDEKIFLNNQYVLQQVLHPVNALNVFFEKQENRTMQLSVENHRKFPLQILGLTTTDGRKFGGSDEEILIKGHTRETVTIQLNNAYERLFVNKKKRKSGFDLAKDIEKIALNYRVLGTKKVMTSPILPWTEQGIQASDVVLLKQKANLKAYDFLLVDEEKRTIICKQGAWKLMSPLIIPAGYIFYMGGDTQIDLLHGDAMIISFSPVRFMGRTDAPITFTSSNSRGGGLLVLTTKDTSIVEHCKFTQLSNSTKPGWVISGAVNFYQAPVKIRHSAFTKNRCEDALNIISTDFELEDVIFSDIYADAFDGDFVKGKIMNCFFENIGNDAIDVSNAAIKIENVLINLAGDKGLSAGENSQLWAKNCIIKQSEIGVASKDQSTINISTSLLANNKLAFTAFQKKSEFGPAKIFADSIEMKANNYDFLIEENSFLRYNQRIIKTVQEVKERMYGIEFGKSSR